MPVLLLAGGLELSAQLPWAEQEAARIPRGTLVVIGDSGHSAEMTSRQGAAAAEKFLLGPGQG